jgi:hypothetical protein
MLLRAPKKNVCNEKYLLYRGNNLIVHWLKFQVLFMLKSVVMNALTLCIPRSHGDGSISVSFS